MIIIIIIIIIIIPSVPLACYEILQTGNTGISFISSHFKVCIHHFHDEDIERKFIYFDGNKMVEMPRKRIALKKSAIPSIFPDCSILRGVRKSENSSRSPTRGKKYTGCVMLLYPLK